MLFEIALRGADEGITGGLVGPQILGERDGIDVARNGDDEAERENDDVRAPLVPAGDAIHGAVEPAFNSLAKSLKVAAGVVEQRLKRGFHLRILDLAIAARMSSAEGIAPLSGPRMLVSALAKSCEGM